MPHTHSAWKRNRKSEKRRVHNKTVIKGLKKARRQVAESIQEGDVAKATTDAQVTQKTLDRVAEKGYIHKNKAARLKSRLAKRLKKLAAAGEKKA